MAKGFPSLTDPKYFQPRKVAETFAEIYGVPKSIIRSPEEIALSESMRYLANRRWAQLTADERAASTEPARLARLKKRRKSRRIAKP